jgi:hypothetical protein
MKWYVIVFFLSFNNDGSRNTFVFNAPTFNSEAECRITLTDKQSIMNYVHLMMLNYQGNLPGSIEKVNCIDQDMYDKLKQYKRQKEGKRDT